MCGYNDKEASEELFCCILQVIKTDYIMPRWIYNDTVLVISSR